MANAFKCAVVMNKTYDRRFTIPQALEDTIGIKIIVVQMNNVRINELNLIPNCLNHYRINGDPPVFCLKKITLLAGDNIKNV